MTTENETNTNTPHRALCRARIATDNILASAEMQTCSCSHKILMEREKLIHAHGNDWRKEDNSAYIERCMTSADAAREIIARALCRRAPDVLSMFLEAVADELGSAGLDVPEGDGDSAIIDLMDQAARNLMEAKKIVDEELAPCIEANKTAA